jgi:hypothetical protein
LVVGAFLIASSSSFYLLSIVHVYSMTSGKLHIFQPGCSEPDIVAWKKDSFHRRRASEIEDQPPSRIIQHYLGEGWYEVIYVRYAGKKRCAYFLEDEADEKKNPPFNKEVMNLFGIGIHGPMVISILEHPTANHSIL